MTIPKRNKHGHVIRTKVPGYFFGALKAADSQQKRAGTARKTAKLPTSLAEQREMEKKP